MEEVDFLTLEGPAGIPRDSLLSKRTNVLDHLGDEELIREVRLIRTQVDVRHIKTLGQLREDILDDALTLGRLHIEAHGSRESGAVTRHIDLGDERDTQLLAQACQIL